MRTQTNILLWSVLVFMMGWADPLLATETEKEPEKHFISSSLFMLMNLTPENPEFYQINYGYRLTTKDTLIVEAITWTYEAPLGIPWGSEMFDSKNGFDGFVRDVGVGLAYQRFWWKGLYTTLHATPFWQLYYDAQDEYIQSGFQLFMTLRAGYHFTFFDNLIFLEPSVAATAWPINTNLPDDFAQKENQWPSYFLFEPGLHIGINF